MPVTRWRWWSVGLRGVAAVVLGLVSLFLPGLTAFSLVLVYGVYALVDGLLALVLATSPNLKRRSGVVVRGTISIVAALMAFLLPGFTGLALLLLVGGWAVAAGVAEIVMAAQLRRHLVGEWLLATEGMISILFGVLLLLSPVAGAIVVGLWLGAYALVIGGTMIGTAFRLRQRDRPASAAA